MAAGAEGVERLAIAVEDGRLVLADDDLRADAKIARAGLRHAIDHLILPLIGRLYDIDDPCHGVFLL